jgi:hypothetical protein
MENKHMPMPWEMMLMCSVAGVHLGRHLENNLTAICVAMLFGIAYVCVRVTLSMFVHHLKGE